MGDGNGRRLGRYRRLGSTNRRLELSMCQKMIQDRTVEYIKQPKMAIVGIVQI